MSKMLPIRPSSETVQQITAPAHSSPFSDENVDGAGLMTRRVKSEMAQIKPDSPVIDMFMSVTVRAVFFFEGIAQSAELLDGIKILVKNCLLNQVIWRDLHSATSRKTSRALIWDAHVLGDVACQRTVAYVTIVLVIWFTTSSRTEVAAGDCRLVALNLGPVPGCILFLKYFSLRMSQYSCLRMMKSKLLKFQ